MLSPKYYNQLLQDIKNAYNANPPSDTEDLFVIEEEEGDGLFFGEDEKPLTEIDILEPEQTDEEIDAEEEEAEQKMIEYFADVEAYLEFDEEKSDAFGEMIGLDRNMFPATDQFSTEQLESIVTEFTFMLRSHRVSINLPKGLEVEKKYELSIAILDERFYIGTVGNTGWDWCTQDSEVCPYEEHCSCIEIERDFENEKADAKATLRALRTCVQDFMKEGKLFTYEVDHTLVGEFGDMSMYISHGTSYVPMGVSLFKNRWRDTIINLKKYLHRHPNLAELFDEDDPISGYKVLEDFLSLSTSCPRRSHFKIEPFYIENGQIIKGYKAPDVNLPIDDFDRPEGEPLDDKDLPF